MSNYWNTNFPAQQGGSLTFRYAIVTGEEFQRAQLTRDSLEAMTPLEFDRVDGKGSPAKFPPITGSMMGTDNKDVILSTWKTASTADGTVVRLVEIAGKPQQVQLTFPQTSIASAHRCSILEDQQQPLPATAHELRIAIKPWEIVTVCLSTTPSAAGGGQ